MRYGLGDQLRQAVPDSLRAALPDQARDDLHHHLRAAVPRRLGQGLQDGQREEVREGPGDRLRRAHQGHRGQHRGQLQPSERGVRPSHCPALPDRGEGQVLDGAKDPLRERQEDRMPKGSQAGPSPGSQGGLRQRAQAGVQEGGQEGAETGLPAGACAEMQACHQGGASTGKF